MFAYTGSVAHLWEFFQQRVSKLVFKDEQPVILESWTQPHISTFNPDDLL